MENKRIKKVQKLQNKQGKGGRKRNYQHFTGWGNLVFTGGRGEIIWFSHQLQTPPFLIKKITWNGFPLRTCLKINAFSFKFCFIWLYSQLTQEVPLAVEDVGTEVRLLILELEINLVRNRNFEIDLVRNRNFEINLVRIETLRLTWSGIEPLRSTWSE